MDAIGQEVAFNPASPGSPTPHSVDPGQIPTAIACPSTGQCTAVDLGGNEVTFNPAAPGSPTPASVDTAGLAGVSCPSTSQCTAVDTSGGEVTFNPAAPGSPARVSLDATGLTGISCPATTQCTAVDAGGGAVVFNPTSPGSPTVGSVAAGARLNAVACFSTSCVAVDAAGHEFAGTTPPAPPPSPPAASSAPTISGTALQGAALTEAHGTWSGSPTSYGYQWERCNSSGANCTSISGANAQSYTLGSADVGTTIRVVETASNVGGSGPPLPTRPPSCSRSNG